MERIRLNKQEKQVLRLLAISGRRPDTFPAACYNAAVRSLHRKGLVFGVWSEEKGLVSAILTGEGEEYLAVNPRLTNPIRWNIVAVVISGVSVLVAICALLVACSNI